MSGTQQLSTKHLLGIKNLTAADIRLIFDTAREFKEVINRPIKKGAFAARHYGREPVF